MRVDQEGPRNGVRDPRTGARVGNVAAVLSEGRIDDFLLACVRKGLAAAGEPVAEVG